MVLLRPARMDDIPALTRWDAMPHVVSATGDDDVIDWAADIAADPPWREILLAENDGRALGVVQIIDPHVEDTHYWGEVPPNLRAIDIWIGEADDLGRGYGTQMMRLALDRCFSPPEVTAVLIDPLESNVAARRFYERMGFVAVGPRVFGTDHCMVYRLDRDAWGGRT